MSSHNFSYRSEAPQSRKCTGNSAPTMTVIKGSEPEDHFLLVCTPNHLWMRNPLHHYDIVSAAIIMDGNKGSMDRLRAERFADLRNLIEGHSTPSDSIENLPSRNSTRGSRHINMASHAILGDSICLPDMSLKSMFTFGAKPMEIQTIYVIFHKTKTSRP